MTARPASEFEADTDVSAKYWNQRYRLMSKLDDGVFLTPTAWFEMTPERIAEGIAAKCFAGVSAAAASAKNQLPAQEPRRLVAVDVFCGCGADAIQLALSGFDEVIAIDVDGEAIVAAQRNAEVYGVADKVTFIHADFYTFAPLKCDLIHLSPPWGGAAYQFCAYFDVHSGLREACGTSLAQMLQHAAKFSSNIAVYLPRMVLGHQVLAEAHSAGLDISAVECAPQLLNGKCKATCWYFGAAIIAERCSPEFDPATTPTAQAKCAAILPPMRQGARQPGIGAQQSGAKRDQ